MRRPPGGPAPDPRAEATRVERDFQRTLRDGRHDWARETLEALEAAEFEAGEAHVRVLPDAELEGFEPFEVDFPDPAR